MLRSKSTSAQTVGAKRALNVAPTKQIISTIAFAARKVEKKLLRTFWQSAGLAMKTSIAIHNVHLN
jgi:hypothetical protein